jgi:hypothetical protein
MFGFAEGVMRGYTSEQRHERKEAVKRAELDRTSHQIVLAARQALITAIEQFSAPGGLDPRVLRMVAISGLFSDVIAGMAGTAAAAQLIEVINRQLEQSGLRLVPAARN